MQTRRTYSDVIQIIKKERGKNNWNSDETANNGGWGDMNNNKTTTTKPNNNKNTANSNNFDQQNQKSRSTYIQMKDLNKNIACIKKFRWI